MEMERCKETVLIVHNYYQIPGGEDAVVCNEKELLEEHGHKVILYTRNNSELKVFSKGRKLLLPFTTIFNPRTYRDIKKIVRKEQVDVIHVHNTLNLISPAVYYAARTCRKPVVQTIHNFRLLCPGATFYRDGHICEDCVEKGLQCAVKHKCYRNSRMQTLACAINLKVHRMTGIYRKIYYICLTDFNREKLLQLPGLKPEQVYVKPNFVMEKGNELLGKEEREDFFLYAGRLDSLKGVPQLLDTWIQMGEKAPKLILCGSGPLESWCRGTIEKHHLRTIEFRGQTPWEEVQKLMGKARAMILPTQWYEGFPMTIVEAYSVGTPVIGPSMGNVGDLIEEGITGWKYPVNGVERIGQTINDAMSTPVDYHRIGELYKQRYSSELNYQQLVNIYRKAQ